MKIMLIMIVLMSVCLAVSAQLVMVGSSSEKIQNVGGDFGRAWLNSHQAQSAGSAAQVSNNTSSAWGGAPKGKAEIDSNLVNRPNTPKSAANWLDDSTILGNQTSPANASINRTTQPQPYFISKTLSPIHKMDASFNQTALGSPQPDANGLINGWPADTYYAIGPALDYL